MQKCTCACSEANHIEAFKSFRIWGMRKLVKQDDAKSYKNSEVASFGAQDPGVWALLGPSTSINMSSPTLWVALSFLIVDSAKFQEFIKYINALLTLKIPCTWYISFKYLWQHFRTKQTYIQKRSSFSTVKYIIWRHFRDYSENLSPLMIDSQCWVVGFKILPLKKN